MKWVVHIFILILFSLYLPNTVLLAEPEGTVKGLKEQPLSSFMATPSKKQVILEWLTKSERETLGFNLYRSESREGEYVKINPDFILGGGSLTEGSKYQLIDKNVEDGRTYYYKLEQVDIRGNGTMYGPVNAAPK